jgi:serine-type D-Ala-D-Ala carboxypeptidase/endopeptidase (penicillin-binding protein 4)
MLTGAAALAALGPEHRFRTTVVSADRRQITLVGGGDPLLERAPLPAEEGYPARADISTLAQATAESLQTQGRTRVRLRYDATLFAGPAISPHWEPSYVPENEVTPVSPLWVDEGRASADSGQRSRDPAAAAANIFAAELRERKITVVGSPEPEAAPQDATELAAVESAPLGQIVQRVLDVSDNEGAEVLARHVAIAAGLPGSFESIGEAYGLVLGELGVETSGNRIYDGSGLSRDNRLQPETLLQLMEVAADPAHTELRPVLSGLPVAGFTGSLTYRFETGEGLGLGLVRAKTGTLTGVHGLAGTLTTQDGVVLAFVAVADKVRFPNSWTARAILDQIAAALAACTCAEPV